MLDFIQNFINSVGYIGITILMIVENIFPPVPSEVIMPFAGFTVREGKLTLAGVTIAGTLGSVLGALPLYYLGHKMGKERLEKWAEKHGHWLGLTPDHIDRADQWLDKYGVLAVLIGRLVPGVRSVISVPAGFSGMNIIVFLICTAVGSAIWSGALAYAGYLLGQNYETVGKYLDPLSYVIIGGLIIGTIYWIYKQRKEHSQ